MAVAGIGVDIVEIERMRNILERTPRFKQRVFTVSEQAYCDSRPNPAASYAGCFAAREAVLKALGTGFSGMGFTDVSVDHDDRGRPVAVLAGHAQQIAQEQGVLEVFLSISHTRDIAVANAVASTAQTRVKREIRTDEKTALAEQFKQARKLLDELDRKEEDA